MTGLAARTSAPAGGGRAFAQYLPAGRRDEATARPVVCVQGLGFVGAAMAAAVARARDGAGEPAFDVLGVDLPGGRGEAAAEALAGGCFPFESGDQALAAAVAAGVAEGNLAATTDPSAYGLADVILVDVNLDVSMDGDAPRLCLEPFREAIATLGAQLRPGALVIVETTVPPGTCERVVAPLLSEALAARGLDPDGFLLAHSYERVMPGPDYLESIVNYWRAYAGHTGEAADACEAFLNQIINTADFPLRRLGSTTASETAKLLENSYRAVNIALIEEWSRFAEAVGVDLFEVIDAIRQRPTHSNIRWPGFGVGGYCLPKDPLLAGAGAREIFGRHDLAFPFCELAVATNRAMPLACVDALERLLGGTLEGRRVLLLGVSYRPGVADTRFAPAETFVVEARRRGAAVAAHDPLVRRWAELDMAIPEAPPDPAGFDALVFAVGHDEYRRLDLGRWLGAARPAVLDADGVLDAGQRQTLRALGCELASIGRGEARP